MSNISSATVFNFTNRFDYLISNLQKGIYCSNYYEKLPLKNNGYSAPMCCFCDIPLSMINQHFKWYGKFGLGINKTYAKNLGMRPVWYVTSENNYVHSIVKNEDLEVYQKRYIVPYLKQYYGKQKDDKGIEKYKKFYNEREWRYIADNRKVNLFFGKTYKRKIADTESRLKISTNAIEYIIIENETYLERLYIQLKAMTTRKIKYESLVSKILTADKIIKDF